MDNRDLQRIMHIRAHCEDVAGFIERFGCNYDTFVSDRAYFNSVAMCVLQIGELANGLSEDFVKTTQAEVPWREIRGMRNLLAHDYGNVDEFTLWQTAKNDIPFLLKFCNKLLGSESTQ